MSIENMNENVGETAGRVVEPDLGRLVVEAALGRAAVPPERSDLAPERYSRVSQPLRRTVSVAKGCTQGSATTAKTA